MLIDRPGTFRCHATFNGWRKSKDTQSLGMRIMCYVYEFMEQGEWVGWNYSMEIEYTAWIRKRDGSVNDKAVESLMDIFGWNGQRDHWHEGDEIGDCQVVADWEDYKGEQHIRAKFINPVDAVPVGGAGEVTDEELRDAFKAMGPSLRVIAGNMQRNAPKPEKKNDDNIPF